MVIAALVVIINGLASAPASGLALVIAGGAAVLVVAVRILMLVRENGVAMRMWREASNSLRDLADRTGDMVLICDLDGTISYASPLASGYSYPTEALIGKPLSDFVHPEDIRAAQAAVAMVIGLPEDAAAALGTAPETAGAGEATRRTRPVLLPGPGRRRHVAARRVRGAALPGARRARPDAAERRDVSDQVALRQQVTHLTFHDGLTGLPNRAYVEERAREALEPSGERVAGVIFLDLDGFTAVNDLIGHGAGRPGARPGGQAAAGRRAGPGHGLALGRRRVRRADGERRGRPGDHRARRAAGRRHRRASRSGWPTGTSG